MGSPSISVVMPAYNEAAHIDEAIVSVLNQTHQDFELIVVDDGSSDGTSQIVASYAAPRVRLVVLAANVGVAAARNIALGAARGIYCATLDADDIAYRHRLAQQAAFLDAHPGVVLVGGAFDLIDERGLRVGAIHPASNALRVGWNVHFETPVATSMAMFRREAALSAGGFDEDMRVGEDYSLWERMSHDFGIDNLNQSLGAYRQLSSGLSSKERKALITNTVRVSTRAVRSLLGRAVSEDDVAPLTRVGRACFERGSEQASRSLELLLACLEAYRGRWSLRDAGLWAAYPAFCYQVAELVSMDPNLRWRGLRACRLASRPPVRLAVERPLVAASWSRILRYCLTGRRVSSARKRGSISHSQSRDVGGES